MVCKRCEEVQTNRETPDICESDGINCPMAYHIAKRKFYSDVYKKHKGDIGSTILPIFPSKEEWLNGL